MRPLVERLRDRRHAQRRRYCRGQVCMSSVIDELGTRSNSIRATKTEDTKEETHVGLAGSSRRGGKRLITTFSGSGSR